MAHFKEHRNRLAQEEYFTLLLRKGDAAAIKVKDTLRLLSDPVEYAKS
jgi:hypothetical protein